MASINVAINERAFNELIKGLGKKLESLPPFSCTGSFGPFSLRCDLGFRLVGGKVALTNTGRVHIDELQLTYDPFILTFGLDLPHIHVGGECIIWLPRVGCVVRLPEIDIWGDNPDIEIPLDLSHTIVSEFSGEFTAAVRKQVLVAKGTLTDHQAHVTPDTSIEIRDRFRTIISSTLPFLPSAQVNALADALVPYVKGNLADKWQFFLHDVWHDFDLIDIAATAANILRNLVNLIIDKILAFVPEILRDIVKAIISPIISAIEAILDIPDDILEWLSSLLQTSFGLLDVIAQFIINFIGAMVPFYQFESNYPMIEDASGLIPVLVPVENVAVTINDDELTMLADIL
ncbi:MAG: hypothetical protein NTU53_06940 [Planctomycetota bacterium]|nr:hypothetical protein [Planctomycetota bacterium]